MPAQETTARVPLTVLRLTIEYRYFLDKSQALFAGLRDLPHTGRNWQPYFQRTFEVYTRLWKHQQIHRAVLEKEYGLKRYEIGELASKIGQLYYHYYLRTSDTTYLKESFVFYEAIHHRQYFKDVLETKQPSLMIKKLRYFARFIVVCLLLNKHDMIKSLMDELTIFVDEYQQAYKPTDSDEWKVVLSEIETFLEAEKKLATVDTEGKPFTAPYRLQLDRMARIDRNSTDRLKLQEAILVGNYQNQIKFSELTIDLYRILQSLEREPPLNAKANPQNIQAEPMSSVDTKDIDEQGKSVKRTNPKKYLLYRPTFAQMMLYLITSFKDLGDNSAMLLYLSADGSKRTVKPEQSNGYMGGVATAVIAPKKTSGPEKVDTDQNALIHSFHPADLIPLTRKPLFVIVDSNNSTAFKDIPRVFDRPFACFMSPTEYPPSIKDTTPLGGLFTLFLHCPIKAFAFFSDITQCSPEIWSQGLVHLNETEKQISDMLETDEQLDKSYKKFMQDDFLRQFCVRFVLCSVMLQGHVNFKDPKHRPLATPSFPSSLVSHPQISNRVEELAKLFSVSPLYSYAESQ
ncbi:protein SCAI [Gorgonomyces haynaldii]|nr:protein SCAI [Gorgonomyces haynaldii]